MGRNKKRDDSKLPHRVPPKGQAEEKADDLQQAKRGAGVHHWSHVDGCDIFSMFEDVFGFGDLFRDGLRRQGPQPGANLCCEIYISDEQASCGMSKTVRVIRRELCEACSGSGSASGKRETCRTCGGQGRVQEGGGFLGIVRDCSHCHGTGTVVRDPCGVCRGKGTVEVERIIDIKIPAGVKDGQQLCCRGAGHEDEPGAPRGHLYATLHILRHAMVHTLRRRQGLLKRLANYFRPVTKKDQSDQPKDEPPS